MSEKKKEKQAVKTVRILPSERLAAKNKELSAAYEEGRKAFLKEHKRIRQCPYHRDGNRTLTAEKRAVWRQGWRFEQRQRS